jgi:hypothetical protein
MIGLGYQVIDTLFVANFKGAIKKPLQLGSARFCSRYQCFC